MTDLSTSLAATAKYAEREHLTFLTLSVADFAIIHNKTLPSDQLRYAAICLAVERSGSRPLL